VGDDLEGEARAGRPVNQQQAQLTAPADALGKGRDGAVIERKNLIADFHAGFFGRGIGRNFGHKNAREANAAWPAIPLASAVEQCAVERKPVGAFAPRSPAARAIAQLWTAIERKLASQ
jgi:hypothetical protein